MPGKLIGRPPLKRGERSVHLGVRVPESTYGRLMVLVDEANARAESQGLPPVNVSWVARSLIIRGLSEPAVEGMGETAQPLPPLTGDTLGQAWESALKLAAERGEDVEKLLADAARNVDAWRANGERGHTGPVGADEVVTSQPTHRKRVRAVVPSELPPPVPEPPPEAGQQDAAEGAPEGEDDLVDAEALLRGTPL